MKRYFLPALLVFLSASLFAQTAGDVLKFSLLQPSGTARYVGVGSSMGGLGADFGTLSSNPAGLAMFRSNEFTVTPSLRFAHTDAQLAGNPAVGEDRTVFGFDNVGLVFNTTPRAGRWKTFNVGLGFNRMNNYNQAIYYDGNAPGTIMNGFFAETQSVFNSGGDEEDLYPFGARLAWDANAIYFQNNDLTYDFAGFENATIDHAQTVTTYGSMNEMVLSFAGNYDEKLMVGATVGVPFVNYRLESTYEESDPGGDVDGNVPYFGQLIFTDYLRTEGVGINFKMGLIYRINQAVRLGAAFHTPTSLGLTDNYSNTFSYDYGDGGGSYTGETIFSPDGVFDYKLRTPWRFIASGAFVIKKYGFVSADVEWLDYGGNRYNFTSDIDNTENQALEREVNNEIQRTYQSAMNIRVGGELALDQFRLRAGVNLNGDPEEGASGFNTGFSVGGGVHAGSFFIDLAYRRFTGEGIVTANTGAPTALTDNAMNDVSLTVGFKF
ncbi:MAG TPA: outer membrane protein transport protein [Saprospiraceae bacterium]|nr:outer membrane protein transport protein [Saprospiraceae bacterium]